MANVQIPSFSPTAYLNLLGGSASVNAQLPTTGTPSIALVANVGNTIAYVVLGTSNAVTASPNNGVTIFPNEQIALTIGTNTWIAAIGSRVHVAVGV